MELVEFELRELENVFSLIVFGEMLGFPSPPAEVMLELMPLMENEITNMLESVSTANDAMGVLFSYFDIG